MKKLYSYFLFVAVCSILAYGIAEEQSFPTIIVVNPVSGIVNVSPNQLSINAPPLSFVEKTLAFFHGTNEELNVSLYFESDEIAEWVSFSENNFTLEPNEAKDIAVYINIPNTETGTFFGNIHAAANNQDLIIPAAISVTDEYKIDVDISVCQRLIGIGDNLSILTILRKLKSEEEAMDVDGKITVGLEYKIFRRWKLITTFATTMEVEDLSKKTVSIPIPENSGRSLHYVTVTATHLDKKAHDSQVFYVMKKIPRWYLRYSRWFAYWCK